MSYRVRYTMPDGRTGLWAHDYQTREAAQAAIDDRLADTGFAYAVEEVAEPGSTAAHHVEILRNRVKELEEELASLKTSFAASVQGTAKASEVPGDGGDSDRRRLEALERFLDVNGDASLTWWEGEFHAVAADVVITAPTLLAIADKLMEKKEAKP